MMERIDRRQFIKAAGLGAAVLAAPGYLNAGQQQSSRKPNIILIMADDIGYECFGCYGSKSYKTPVLDELAATGMRFEHCYSQPLCTPS
jgi:arylsulfatase A